MDQILYFIRYPLLLLRWKRIRRRGKTLRLRIGKVANFFQALNRAHAPYVVLRWFDEVPLTASSTTESQEDVDLLVHGEQLYQVVRIAARYPGKIRFDIYSPTGSRGTGYRGMPYYPPLFAEEILKCRKFYQGQFFIPAPKMHFLSLAYHLVYHKGIESGITTGADLPTTSKPKRDYAQSISQIATALKISLPQPITLTSLHQYLKSQMWSMPHDLMVRWPKQNPWIDHLIDQEESPLRDPAKIFDHLIVFLLRDDIFQSGLESRAVDLLGQRFHILRQENLDPEQTNRMLRMTRGGNWVEHKGTEFLPPRMAVICYDSEATPFTTGDPRQRKYPFLQNQNVLYKIEMREELSRLLPPGKKLIGIHGSDNAIETQHYLKTIYAGEYPQVLDHLKARMPS